MPSRATTSVFALAALLPALTHAVTPDVDIDELASSYPEFFKGLMKYGQHFRHSNHRHTAFLKHSHNVHHAHHATLEEELEGIAPPAEVNPMKLLGRHPSVEKALDGMAGDLESLKESKLAAASVRGDLEGTVNDALHHMNDPYAMQRAIKKKEVQLRIDDGKVKALEKDAGRLRQTHDSLMTSLHRMLGPKVMFARQRLVKKEKFLHKEEEAARAWLAKKDQLKTSAMEVIKKRESSHQILLEAEAEMARAKKKEMVARMRYEHEITSTADKVQSYRYAETRYKAEVHHEHLARTAVEASRQSLHNLYSVEKVEQEKVDKSIVRRKEHLQRKMQTVEAARDKTSHELTDLAERYSSWEGKQRERTADVVKKSRETQEASRAYAARQQQVLDAASAKVTKDAEGAGDWDGWGGESFSKDMRAGDSDDTDED